MKSVKEGPIYRQVEQFLRDQIEAGLVAPGDKLPSVSQLCEQFGGIHHLTVRQAIKNLALEGLVRPIQGRGLFVAEQKIRNSCIALVVPSVDDAMASRMIKGIQTVFKEARVNSLIMDSECNPKKEAENIRQIQDLPLQGAIIFPIPLPHIIREIIKLHMDGLPFVLVDRFFPGIELPSVTVDNYRGVYELTAHLIRRGHKRFAWVGRTSISTTGERYEGFRDALNDHQIACQQRYVKKLESLTVNVSAMEAACAAVKEILGEKTRPDAMVFANDSLALMGMEEIKRKGVRIPEDIAVAGFDDIERAGLAVPSLTTVRQPVEAMGGEAARYLLEQLSGRKTPPRRIVLPVELAVRNSG
ncbi:MAG: GntR family transcriptional regulator [Verrucomicrobiae bacterium]|nr:GntR family transcriptional regulator [Verrucomicrobiae bacterium]